MSDLHVLPLRGHDLPHMRLYTRARVFRIAPGLWTWEHRCDQDTNRVSLVSLADQATAFRRAWVHVRRCC